MFEINVCLNVERKKMAYFIHKYNYEVFEVKKLHVVFLTLFIFDIPKQN